MTTFVNLLPPAVRRRALLLRRARQWGALWGLAVLIVLGVGGARFLADDGAENARREAEQRQNDRLARTQKRLEAVRARLVALREHEALLLNPVDEYPGLLILGIVSQCARQVEGAIQVEELSLSRSGSTSGKRSLSDDSTRKGERVLTLRGIASDNLAVAAFAMGLRDCGVFASVERRSSGVPGADEERPVPYLIECRF